jgi:putative ABC transport system permease protein
MIKHYIKVALRTILKSKTFSFINVFGLAISIACAVLVIFHVKEELKYDTGFSRSERIFRVTQEDIGKDSRHWAATAPPLGPALRSTFPQVEQSVRLHRPSPDQVLSYAPKNGSVKRFEEKGGLFADPQATKVFDLKFTNGNGNTSLEDKNAIVISEPMAEKYFGNEDPVGKTIVDDNAKVPFRVTGVFRPFAFPTHLQIDYLLSMRSIESYQDEETMQRKTWSGFYTYVLLKKAEDKKIMEAGMPAFMQKFYASTGETKEEIISKRVLHLQPVTDIHLHSKLEKEMHPNSDITYVYIFSIAALFIILIAAVNFINMSTANALNRVKEIGVRKVAGATKKQLMLQFLGESLLLTFLATIISILFIDGIVSLYNNLASRNFHFADMWSFSNAVILFILIALIGVLAGLYPAWFISNVNSIASLKAAPAAPGSSVSLVRKGLVVFQFAISVFMIFSTVVVYRQLKYFHDKDIGFDKEQLVAVKMAGEIRDNFPALINELKVNPNVRILSTVSVLPGERFSTQPFMRVGEKEGSSTRIMWADENFLAALQIKLKEGRNFFYQLPEIKTNEFLLNEAAVKLLDLKDPVGKQFICDRDTGIVVGIVNDFNFASLHSGIDPLVIQYQPYRTNYLLVKIEGGHTPRTLDYIASRLKAIAPSAVFSYSFLDEQMNRLYASENRMSQVFLVFAAFAILISCLGLFGLSAYTAKIRTKEVGIRKVLGATVASVTLLISKDFVKLVAIAIAIAWPAAWWVMNSWLEGFAYRITISPLIFLMSGLFAIVVALLTVGSQGMKAALVNPVKSLKTE